MHEDKISPKYRGMFGSISSFLILRPTLHAPSSPLPIELRLRSTSFTKGLSLTIFLLQMAESELLKRKIQPALDRLAESIPIEVRLDVIPTPQDISNCVNFPKSDFLNELELSIIELSATELVEKIAKGELTSEECTRAFIRSAGLATQLVNCCTEILGEEALSKARALDYHLKTTGKTVGPLHGLPMSIKEHTIMKDKVVHSSYVALINNVEKKNGLLVDVLEECGAVLFCRTSQPQSVMSVVTCTHLIEN